MLLVLFACAVVSQTVDGFQPMLPKVVGGLYSNISEHPYAAALSIKCIREGKEQFWGCGSSILNEYLLLTAGHCTSHCETKSYITASVGNNDKKGPNVYSAYSYLKHSDYLETRLWNDIALIRLKTPLKFSQKVARVVLVPNPPYYEKAYIAGWGYISESPQKSGKLLKAVEQHVYKISECQDMYHSIHEGTICASSKSAQDFPSMGDSGSALVVRGYIQIGLVSFKNEGANNRHIIFYTDVGHYYNWIISSADSILCSGDDSINLF